MRCKVSISVVIPTRDRKDLLARALSSVIAQTKPVDEIIVVDDASNDDTEMFVRDVMEKERHIIYVRNPEPLGGSGTRNVGIKTSRGDYIAFLDDDDDWLPEKVERQSCLIEKGGHEIVTCGWRFIGRRGPRGIRPYFIPPAIITYQTNFPKCIVGGSSGVVVKKSVFEELGGFDESLPCLQDYDMWQRILTKYQARAVTEILYSYNVNDEIARITNTLQTQLKGLEIFYRKHSPMMKPSQRRYFKSKPLELRYIFEQNPRKKYLYLWKAMLGAPKDRYKWFFGQHVRAISSLIARRSA